MFFSCTAESVRVHLSLLRVAAVHTYRFGEYQPRTGLSNAVAKVHQLRAAAPRYSLKLPLTTKRLVVGVALVRQYHRLITQVLIRLQHQQTHQPPDGNSRAAFVLAVVLRERLIESPPFDDVGELQQRVVWV